jgi:ABC-type dipeptide/oligopeptide/nickel transport system permease subunit
MLFGWIMDRGAPHWVFGASVVFMVLTVAFALIGDRRSADHRRLSVSPIGSTAR